VRTNHGANWYTTHHSQGPLRSELILSLYGLLQQDLLGGLFTFEEFEKGAVVFSEGSVGDRFYVIVSGEVQASARREPDGDVVLSHLVSNMWFGEIALMKVIRSTAMIISSSSCILVSVGIGLRYLLILCVPGWLLPSITPSLSTSSFPFHHLYALRSLCAPFLASFCCI
jgi:hypothetical protein